MPAQSRPAVLGSVALAWCLLLAGCASAGAPATTATTATTPELCQGTVASQSPLPERPESFDRQSATEFVAAYEGATARNRRVDGRTVAVDVTVTDLAVVNETPTGYVVHVSGGWSHERCGGVQGMGTFAANYFVNGTLLVRLDRPQNRTTDPRWGGTVVERWERE